MRGVFAGIVTSCLAATSAAAQAPVVPSSTPSISVPTACCSIPALTEVKLAIGSTLNSQANHIGEHFPIRLTEPIVIDGKVVVPAGVTGSGDVVHADKSRFGGKAGELVLAVRYLDHNGLRIPLRSLRYVTGRGKDRGDEAIVLGIAVSTVLSMFITGGEVNIPAGTPVVAKTAAAVVVPPALLETVSRVSPPAQEGNPHP